MRWPGRRACGNSSTPHSSGCKMPNTSWRNCSSKTPSGSSWSAKPPVANTRRPKRTLSTAQQTVSATEACGCDVLPDEETLSQLEGQATALTQSIAARRQATEQAAQLRRQADEAMAAARHTPSLPPTGRAAAKPPVRPDGPARTIEAAPACGTSSAGRGRSLRAAASACVCAHSLWRSRRRRSAI
ncbi:MAG: hypothetical protein ACLU38_00965 [Dysosmobacter sp.]